MPQRDISLTLVAVADCEPCLMARHLADELVAQNRPLAIDLRVIDVDSQPQAVRQVGATSHPTLVLTIDGVDAASLAGVVTKRRVLHKFLPVLYPDEAQALRQLRRQLGSPSEDFHRRPRRSRVRQAEKMKLLEEVPLFAEVRRKELGHLARLVDELHRPAGATLTSQGERGDEFFIVVRGGVDVIRDGKRVRQLGPGDTFGEMSLLDDQPRSATVRANANTTLLTIHRGDFDRMLLSNPAFMRGLLTTLSQRLR